jgi:hypothetical protein
VARRLQNNMHTYYLKPSKFFEMKLSFGPKEKKDVLLEVPLISRRNWTTPRMTSYNEKPEHQNADDHRKL